MKTFRRKRQKNNGQKTYIKIDKGKYNFILSQKTVMLWFRLTDKGAFWIII